MQSITLKAALGAALIATLGLTAGNALAQTKSGGRQGPNGHGYSYSATKSGSTVTGSVSTNAGYGATATHTGGTGAYGGRYGSTTVNTNNGSSVTTRSAAYNGLAGGTVSATGPNGQTVYGGGAVYVPH